MNKSQLIKRIMSHPALQEKPPVLIDVGASDEIHKAWKEIAPYSICLAFDADDRDFSTEERVNCGYRKLILVNKIVTAEKQNNTLFYLTKSPYCSSTLKPQTELLRHWRMGHLFDVEKTVFLQSLTLTEVLQKTGIHYVDWFKTDSQGTDLRLFRSLGEEIFTKVKLAEFEPGLIDAYSGEDKFCDLLQWMEDKPFFLDGLHIDEISRISPEVIEKCCNIKEEKFPLETFNGKPTPGWVNAAYMNDGSSCRGWDLRDILLFSCICILRGQMGVCYETAEILKTEFPQEKLGDIIFSYAVDQIRKCSKYTLIYRIRRRLNIMFGKWLKYAEI